LSTSGAAARAGGLRGIAIPAATIAASFLLLWSLYGLIQYACVTAPEYDGGLNLRVAQSFGAGQGYGFIYDSFFPFPAQTDGPLILPAALAFRIGGVTSFSTQVTNLVYVGVFAVVLIRLLLICAAPLWLALAGALLCMQVPRFVTFGMNGFGEVIVLTWFLLGLVILESPLRSERPQTGRFALGGIAFAMAYLTKVVALICVAPSALLALLFIASGRFRFRRAAAFISGMVVPVLAWESFRLYELGSIDGYERWWSLQLGQVQAQSGAASRVATLGALAAKAAAHLDILSQAIGVPSASLLVFIVLPPLLAVPFIVTSRKHIPARFSFACIAVVVPLYFAWWLLVTPTHMAWPRRILDGFVLSQCLIAMLFAAFLNRSSAAPGFRRPAKAVQLCLAAGLAVVAVGDGFVLANGELLPRPIRSDLQESNLRPVLAAIAALPPDARIFGFGWWQAPVLALFAGRDLSNFERWLPSQINALPSKFLLTDYSAQILARGAVEQVLANLTYRKIIETTAGSLYEIRHVEPYPPFSVADETAADLASGIDFANGDYRHKRGIYAPSDGWAWSRPDSAVMLLRSDEDRLTVEVAAIPATVAASSGAAEPLQLRVSVDGCADRAFPVQKGPRQTLNLALDCPAWPASKPLIVRLAFDGHVVPVQQLDADNRLLGFLLFSVRLLH
jgi:hypothetical protein